MLGAVLFLGFFLLSFAYSMWRGGAPERVGAALLLAGLAGSMTVGIVHLPGNFASVPVTLAAVDMLLALALVILALRANRLWPIPLAACQLITVFGHIGKYLAPQMFAGGYALLIMIWSWPMTGLLMFGAYCHHRRIRTGYCDRPWKNSSPAKNTMAGA
jgi:hypothetical protein